MGVIDSAVQVGIDSDSCTCVTYAWDGARLLGVYCKLRSSSDGVANEAQDGDGANRCEAEYELSEEGSSITEQSVTEGRLRSV